jgi:hypothetical protein
MPTSITLQYSRQEAMITIRDLSSDMHLGVAFYVSRKILEQHNGHLELQSFPGNRRTLFMKLPLVSTPEIIPDQLPVSRPTTCATGNMRYFLAHPQHEVQQTNSMQMLDS